MPSLRPKGPRVSMFFYAAPFQPIRNQGISRLLIHQLSGLALAQGSIDVLTARWNIKSLKQIAKDQNVVIDGIRFISPPLTPGILTIYFFQRILYESNVKSRLKRKSKFISSRSLARIVSVLSVVIIFVGSQYLIGLFGLLISALLNYWTLITKKLLSTARTKYSQFYYQIVASQEKQILSVEKKMNCVWLVPSPHQSMVRSFRNPVVMIIPDVVGIEYPFLFGANSVNFLQFGDNLKELEETIKVARAVICYSNSVKKRQVSRICLLEESRIFVIPNANTIPKRELINTKIQDPTLVIEEYFFYPTQLRTYKNIETLIEALYIYNKVQSERNLPSAMLLLTGAGEASSAFNNLIEDYNLTDHVEFTGEINGSQLDYYYRNSLSAISPSWHEGGFSFFPISEAWAQDTPCVFSLTRSNIELLGNHERRYTFKPGSASELAQKMLDVAKNRGEILAQQKRELREIFSRSWQDVAHEYLRVANSSFPNE